MMNLVTVKSKSTGLVGQYPESHLALDPDLELVEDHDETCEDCVIAPFQIEEFEYPHVKEIYTDG